MSTTSVRNWRGPLKTILFLSFFSIVSAFGVEGALDDQAITCYHRARQCDSSSPCLNISGSLALCGGTSNADETISCFMRAKKELNLYNTGALSLCSRNYNKFNDITLGN